MFQRVDKILAPGDKKYRSKIEDFKMTPLARDKFGDKYLFESNTTIAENKDCFSSIHFMFVASVSEKRETKLVFETVGKEEKCPSASYGAQFKVLSFGDIRRSGSLDILTYIDDVIAPCIFIDEGDGYVNAGCFEGFGGC